VSRKAPKKKRWQSSITGSGAMALREERLIEQDFYFIFID